MQNNNRKGKWQPFDALSGFHDSLAKADYDKEKVNKPILSSDKKEQINDALALAIDDNSQVIIKYFYDGYIYNIEGYIKKVDVINKTITISNKTINLINIVDAIIK